MARRRVVGFTLLIAMPAVVVGAWLGGASVLYSPEYVARTIA
jgi:hypothetical protein